MPCRRSSPVGRHCRATRQPLRGHAAAGGGRAAAGARGTRAPGPRRAGAGSGGAERARPQPARSDRILPRLDVFFPEGDLDLRISRLINEVVLRGAGQVQLHQRRHHGLPPLPLLRLRRTTQLTVFDSISFDRIDQNVTDDFDRVRGHPAADAVAAQLQQPHLLPGRARPDQHQQADARRQPPGAAGTTNTFIRWATSSARPRMAGRTPSRARPRARTERLFSAFREFGPGGAAFTAALTYGFPYGPGDFDYLKFEFEALKRFDVSAADVPGRPAARGHLPLPGQGGPRHRSSPEPEGIDCLRGPRGPRRSSSTAART